MDATARLPMWIIMSWAININALVVSSICGWGVCLRSVRKRGGWMGDWCVCGESISSFIHSFDFHFTQSHSLAFPTNKTTSKCTNLSTLRLLLASAPTNHSPLHSPTNNAWRRNARTARSWWPCKQSAASSTSAASGSCPYNSLPIHFPTSPGPPRSPGWSERTAQAAAWSGTISTSTWNPW